MSGPADTNQQVDVPFMGISSAWAKLLVQLGFAGIVGVLFVWLLKYHTDRLTDEIVYNRTIGDQREERFVKALEAQRSHDTEQRAAANKRLRELTEEVRGLRSRLDAVDTVWEWLRKTPIRIPAP